MLDLKDIYKDYKNYLNKDIEIQGWIKNHRKQKEFGFIDFNDGTYFKNLQVVYDNALSNFEDITFSFAHATIPFELSTWHTDAPAERHATVAPPV